MSGRVLARLETVSSDRLFISDWVSTEISSALSLKVRTRTLAHGDQTAALAAFQHLVAESLRVLPVTPEHFKTAARYADRSDLGLRASDALHLAMCTAQGLALFTLDRRLRDACLTVGVEVVEV